MPGDKLIRDFMSAVGGISDQKWFHWKGWTISVGCNNCIQFGVESPCWGKEDCHGYWNSCGCERCAERDRRYDDQGNPNKQTKQPKTKKENQQNAV